MRLDPGTTTAIIGSTGSGKSSLLRLFPRLIEASAGSVLAGGINVRELDLTELRARIAIIPQQAFLFSGTVASNVAGRLRVTDQIDRSRVERALRAAQAWDFVNSLDNGMDTQVESGGKNLSGGQRQRLTIARALYRCLPDESGHRTADLLIFDDSFSALDFATDAALRLGLREAVGDVAILIVAQRVATIRQSDAILVLEAGQTAGIGTHEQLMASCSTYQEIVSSQLSAEEAA